MIQELDLLFHEGHLKVHQLKRPTPKDAYAYHSDFCENLRSYSILGAKVTSGAQVIPGAQVTPVPGLNQSLLLHYSQALVEEYNDLVYGLQANYARKKEGFSDPRRATLTIPMLAETTRDVCFYEEVKERVSELAGAIDVLVESLKVLYVDAANYRSFQCLAVELQSTCTDLKRTITTLSTTLENHLRLFELSRDMHEAQNVRLLSILASIFLPLSLACGLLSMQTRFSELHYLLYDFFGVLVLLGTTVAVILAALRSHLWWKRLLTKLEEDPLFRDINPTAQIVVPYCLVLGWGLLISSFLVGMIKDVGLGLKILGYGALVAVGISLLLPCVGGIAFIFWLVYGEKFNDRRRRRRASKVGV